MKSSGCSGCLNWGIGIVLFVLFIIFVISGPFLKFVCAVAAILAVIVYFVAIIASKPPMDIPENYEGKPLAYKYDDVKIAVIRGDEPYFNIIKRNEIVKLIQEPNNKYDANAIAVMLNKMRLGYIYRGSMQDMANDYINRNDPIFAFVDSVDAEQKSITITIAFYREKTTE